MHYDDDLQALRRDLDDLLNRAAGLKDRIAAIENEIKREAVAEERAPAHAPLAAAAPLAPAGPPPLPPMPAKLPKLDEGIAMPPAKPAETPTPTFAGVHASSGPKRPPTETALPGASVEERIWKYWMPRVAGVLIAIGIAWVLYLVGPKTPPWLRVAFGYGVSTALIGVGWALEKKYLQYARVLFATAIGVSYFVSFAAHYVAAARIIESETAGIGLLVAVVIAWGIVAQIRRSKIVATLVTMLGHLTMGLAFFTTGELAQYSIAGVAVLGIGSAFFLLYNRWYYVATVGLVGCYINHTLWTFHFFSADPVPSFQLSFGLLWVYMLTFALAELFCAEDLRRAAVPPAFRTFFVSANTALFFALASLTLFRYENMWEHRADFLLAYSGVLGLVALGYLRLRGTDPLYNAYFVKAVSAFTLFLAVRYGQGTLTASLAVESVVLLYSSRRSGLVVTRILAFGAAALCLAHGLYTVANTSEVTYADPLYWRRVVESGFAVAGLFAASLLYQRTDWSLRSPKSLPFSRATLDSLWDFDFAAEPATKGRRKPYGGLQFPYVYAIGGAILYFAYTAMLVHDRHRVSTFAAFVLAATLAAFVLNARPFSLVAILGLLPTVVGTVLSATAKDNTPLWLAIAAVTATAAAAAFADRRVIGEREGLAFHQMRAAPYLLYCAAAFMLAVTVLVHGQTTMRAALLLALSTAAATALTALLHRRALATAALLLLGFGTFAWMSEWDLVATRSWHASAFAIVAVCVFANRFFARGTDRAPLAPWGAVALAFSWPVMFRYVGSLGKDSWWFEQVQMGGMSAEGFGYFHADWVPFVLALASFAYAAFAAVARSRTSVAIAAFNAAIVSIAIVGLSHGSGNPMGTLPLVCGYVALAAFWGVCERLIAPLKSARFRQAIDPLCGACVAAATLLLVLMVERVPSLSAYFLTIGWGVLAMVLFGVSLVTWQRFYRYAGLGVFLLAIARLFYDARDLEGIYRPLAFIGLAVLMLIVSFGYYRASRFIDAQKPNGAGKPPRSETSPPAGPPPLE